MLKLLPWAVPTVVLTVGLVTLFREYGRWS